MIIELPALHPAQHTVRTAKTRFVALATGRQWGKTYLAVSMAVARAITQEKQTIWWVAPTYAQSRQGFQIARGLISPLIQAGLASLSLSERKITFNSGSTVSFLTADRPDNLRAATLNYLIVDEFEYCDPYVWTSVLQPMLGVRKGSALFISSPGKEESTFHQFIRDNPRRDPKSWTAFQFPTWSSPYWSADEVELARQNMPSIEFRREYGAEFVGNEGALIRREWLKTATDLPASEIVFGVDLAISQSDSADYTAIVILQKTPDGFAVIYADRWRLSFEKILEKIKQLAARFKPQMIGIESVQAQNWLIQELNRGTSLPIRAITPDRDKVRRFYPVAARYEQGLVSHSPNLSEEFIRELLGFPHAEHDDMVDALGYAFQMLNFTGNRVQTAKVSKKYPF